MAYLVPRLLARNGRDAEVETLELLRRQLPPDYTIFHSVPWTGVARSGVLFGEADFVVVNQTGAILIVEQKLGKLEETDHGLAKKYDGKSKSVVSQVHRTLDGIRDKFKDQTGHSLDADYLLYCPDYRVSNLEASGLDSSRIVDARCAGDLTGRIKAILPLGLADPVFAARVKRFFEQRLDLVPDIHVRHEAQERHYAQAVGGLAELVKNMSGRPLHLAVRGTAGCGKSLVAVGAYRDAVARGKRPLLLCFNRDLKEKLKVACGPGGTVETFFGAVDRALGAIGKPINHAEPADWDRQVERAFSSALSDDWKFDCLIVDEGQDFTPDWREMLELELFTESSADRIWLDDPVQAIQYRHGSSSGEWPQLGWTGYRAVKNFRTPTSVAQYIKALLPFDFVVANPLAGNGVGLARIEGRDALPETVGKIAAKLVADGYQPDDIVVLSLRGIAGATLSQVNRCGAYPLRRPLGTYDLFGNQEWTAGRLRFDTIRRYKGQQDKAVILTDVDPPSADERFAEWQRLMFAALTRATDRVEIVAGKDSADLLAAA